MAYTPPQPKAEWLCVPVTLDGAGTGSANPTFSNSYNNAPSVKLMGWASTTSSAGVATSAVTTTGMTVTVTTIAAYASKTIYLWFAVMEPHDPSS